MVFPLFDDNTDRQRIPIFNYVLIGINVFVFFVLQQGGVQDNKFTYMFSCVPIEIVTGEDLTEPISIEHPITNEELGRIEHQRTPLSVYLTLLTSMFLHGSIMHLAGNMLFLWIFGDNLEDYMGPWRYLGFYLFCGVLASLAHVATTYLFGMDPRIPSLGASGAISGVLGGYVILFPHRRVTVILFRFLTQVPAWAAIGIWFAFQLISGLGMFGGESGGVAYGAHIGGFLVGLALISVFKMGAEPEPYDRLPPRNYRG